MKIALITAIDTEERYNDEDNEYYLSPFVALSIGLPTGQVLFAAIVYDKHNEDFQDTSYRFDAVGFKSVEDYAEERRGWNNPEERSIEVIDL